MTLAELSALYTEGERQYMYQMVDKAGKSRKDVDVRFDGVGGEVKEYTDTQRAMIKEALIN